MAAGTEEEHSVGDRGSRHVDLVELVDGQLFEVRSGFDDVDVAELAREVEPPVAGLR